jgi:hypothetical protein
VNGKSQAKMNAPGTGANWGTKECLNRCKINTNSASAGPAGYSTAAGGGGKGGNGTRS